MHRGQVWTGTDPFISININLGKAIRRLNFFKSPRHNSPDHCDVGWFGSLDKRAPR